MSKRKVWEKGRFEQRKAKLGMSPGRARNILVGKLLRDLMHCKFSGRCYRCGDEIADNERYNLDHIESWEFAQDPQALYFSTENIAFSHEACNTAMPGIQRRLTSPPGPRLVAAYNWDLNYRKEWSKAAWQRKKQPQVDDTPSED